MTTPAEIPIGDILSVTTGRLVSRDHIGGVYRVCDHMSGEPTFTHALPRVSSECTPSILAQHPQLADIQVPEWENPTKDDVMGWLDGIEAQYGASLWLEPMAPGDHTSIDPISELRMMNPDVKIIAVEVPEETP